MPSNAGGSTMRPSTEFLVQQAQQAAARAIEMRILAQEVRARLETTRKRLCEQGERLREQGEQLREDQERMSRAAALAGLHSAGFGVDRADSSPHPPSCRMESAAFLTCRTF